MAYGMIRADGTKKLSYYAFQDVAGAPVEEPVGPAYKFVLGFKKMHDTNPSLIGDATENEFGPAKDISIQRTTNGVCLWSNTKASGSVMAFLDSRDGKRYLWDGTQLNAI